MLILNQTQLKFADSYSIQHEPIASIDLMERASLACLPEIEKHISGEVFVFCGKGNNGGDGLAITRMLLAKGHTCKAYVIHQSENFSQDAEINYQRLKKINPESIVDIRFEEELNSISFKKNILIIDALFGTGLSKSLNGLNEACVKHLNTSMCPIISIDCPSGLFIDKENNEDDTIIHSTLTLTFHYPKLSFLFAQNAEYVPQFSILNIGLNPDLDNLLETPCFFVTPHAISQLLKKRLAFSHKGHFGHALLLAGSSDMKGAALLSAKSVLKSGAGLLSVHSTNAVLIALTPFLPEAMSSTDSDSSHISSLPPTKKYSAIAMGPGIGMHPETVQVLKKLLNYHQGIPLVLDADAITILSENKTWLSFLPPETILTPHPKEFDRLTKIHYSDFERWESAKRFSQKHACILILKGKFTIICMPDGSSYFNSSGNAGLAKGGSGDVLTGIILGLLARGYTAPKSALIGTFVHGLAADIAVENSSMESLLADDVINHLGKAFYRLEHER